MFKRKSSGDVMYVMYLQSRPKAVVTKCHFPVLSLVGFREW